jgi:hypothetical protein
MWRAPAITVSCHALPGFAAQNCTCTHADRRQSGRCDGRLSVGICSSPLNGKVRPIAAFRWLKWPARKPTFVRLLMAVPATK